MDKIQIIELLEQQMKLLSERSKEKGILLDEITRASEAMATLAKMVQTLWLSFRPID